MSRYRFRSLALPIVVLLGLFLTACSSNDDDDPTPATMTPAAATPITDATASVPTPEDLTPTATLGPTLPPAAPIQWEECPSGPFDCAEYEVPLDYDDPEGEQITLALRRLPAEEPDQRIGLLFANPGGPGGSAIEVLSSWARNLHSQIRDRFDIILFDPRGVGLSTPLVCHDNIQEMLSLEPYPSTQEDWDVIIDATQEFADGCEAADPTLLPHLGTREVARDMDRIREASGETTLNYFGYSYGTSIGQVYADLFPQNVRAMVLDGAIDQSLSFEQKLLEQILGFEAAFQRYLADCEADACIPGDPEQTIRDLIDRAGVEPIPAPRSDRAASAGELLQGVLASLYSQSTWFLLTSGINTALEGDGSVMLLLADSLAGRDDNGEYGNMVEANAAVNCLDSESNPDPAHYQEIAAEFAEKAPTFGLYAAQGGIYCALWPAEPDPLDVPSASGAPPIMVIGNTGDPATPYKWAVTLARQLESGFLVTNDVEGHSSYRLTNKCIDDLVNAYLVDLTVPPDGSTCGDAGIEPDPPVQ